MTKTLQGDVKMKYKTYFDIWWNQSSKNISILNYKDVWRKNKIKPMLKVRTNGAKRKNGDGCFELFIYIGYMVINYTNFNLQGKTILKAKEQTD